MSSNGETEIIEEEKATLESVVVGDGAASMNVDQTQEPAEAAATEEETASADDAPQALDPAEEELLGSSQDDQKQDEAMEGMASASGEALMDNGTVDCEPVDRLLDESAAYDTHTLVRGLHPWEISRDYLVFADMCGQDAGKRHVVHVLEPPHADGAHGGVLLVAAGNTIQLVTLARAADADRTRKATTNVQSRKYLFGVSGCGIGALAVHPSRRFFAVGEKGVKPMLMVHQYPSTHVCRVLRQGTERGYSSVAFSGGDGETLASVGEAPDYLLTVWRWRSEQTILRCRAFGQDVFSVRFAPTDSGFLTTSGVGHIRFWKMADTFTGLKLQGDIGKFGKSELSDIDAFCVLPDKKVLSGTERGVLLLWDGPFIKCEIMMPLPATATSASIHGDAPHAGAIRVVQLELECSTVVTAGSDGCVKFWRLDDMDRADVPPDDHVARVRPQRVMCVQRGMDIRAVVKLEDARYLVQDATGALHLLLLHPAVLVTETTPSDSEHEHDAQLRGTFDVVLHYVGNASSATMGVVCSPYEHLAASCGADGGVRAWDYVSRRCLFTSTLPVGGAVLAAATAIAWVPTASALPLPQSGDARLPGSGGKVSRQVVVGYGDGLVRVLLMDLARRAWVRTNVFKPHNARVTALAFSKSGLFLATASDDATVFLFKTEPQDGDKKAAPDYLPLGFQRVSASASATATQEAGKQGNRGDAVRGITWRDDDEALLVTLVGGAVVEYDIPMDGSLEALAARRQQRGTGDDTGDSAGNAAIDGSAGGDRADEDDEEASETYELQLTRRAFTGAFHHRRPLSVKELDALAVLADHNSNGGSWPPAVAEAVRTDFHCETAVAARQARSACYHPSADTRTLLVSLSASPAIAGLYASAVMGSGHPVALAGEPSSAVTSVTLSNSGQYVLCGLANGKFQVRSASHPHAFLTGEFHDGGNRGGDGDSNGGGGSVALSFDDSFVLCAGRDGNLSVSRLHADRVTLAARLLTEKHEKLMVEATIVGDQAADKQRAAVEARRRAAEAAAARDDDGDGEGGCSAASSSSSADDALDMLPAFARARASAAYIEAQLVPPPRGTPDENEVEGDDDARSKQDAHTGSVAFDDEGFRGVVRLVTDTNSTLGLPLAVLPVVPESTGNESGSQGSGMLGWIEVADVSNPGEAYTIEDAKRKSAAAARARAALSKQDRTREILRGMRAKLQELRACDAGYPAPSRLDADEWEIDLDFADILATRGTQACEDARRALAFDVERAELRLRKLRDAFLAPLAVERVTLHAFRSGLCVQTFRTLKMPANLQKRLQELHTDSASEASECGNVRTTTTGTKPPAAAKTTASRVSVLHIMTKDAASAAAVAQREDFPLQDEERRLIRGLAASATGTGPPAAPSTAMGTTPSGATTAATTTVHGFEARKQLRAARQQRLTHWADAKPGADADDPRDVVALSFAQRHLGDYQLKTAPGFVVPEAQRVNAARKRRQMALLEEALYEARLAFNGKVLELRELKVLLLQEMRSDQDRALALRGMLETLLLEGSETKETGVAVANRDGGKEEQEVGHALALEVDPSEWPEQRERVSEVDLALFLAEKKVGPPNVDSLTTVTPAATTLTTSRRRSSAQAADRSIAAVSRKLVMDHAPAASAAGEQPMPQVMPNTEGTSFRVRHVEIDAFAALLTTEVAVKATPTGMDAVTQSLAEEERAVRVYVLRQELLRLARKQREEIRAFDAAVAHLRRDRMSLAVACKQSELRLFTLRQELSLLEQLESRETALAAKLSKSRGEKAGVMGELAELQDALTAKRRDMDEWGKQERAIQAEFLTLVNGGNSSVAGAAGGGGGGAQHSCFTALQKIFRKKIKRPKKKGGGAMGNLGAKDGGNGGGGDGDGGKKSGGDGNGDGDGNEHSEDEDDSEDAEDDEDEDDDDDDDDDDDEDVCPPGCDLQLYEKVLTLREKRADVDDAVSELARACEDLRKNSERQSGRQRTIDKELVATEHDIQQFQSEKQSRFNQLDVVVALSKQQIRCLTSSTPTATIPLRWVVPEQATGTLVFAAHSFDALTARIEGLQRENRSLRQQFKDLHKQQNVLSREKQAQLAAIAALQDKCEQLQMLKFGQLVDMELLDKACDTSRLVELQTRVRAKELTTERECARAKQSTHELQRRILEATERNTALLAALAGLHARQLALEKELNQANASPSVLHDESAQRERELAERDKLVRVVKLQAREVEALKQEIGLLRGKDGKVYAARG